MKMNEDKRWHWLIREGIILSSCFALYLIGVEYSEFLALLAVLNYLEFRV